MQETSKVILICLIFFTNFFLFGANNYFNLGQVNNTSDFAFHWEKIHDFNAFEGYPDLYHKAFSIFGDNKLLFYTANLLLICVLIPLLLFVGLKSFWSTIIYFCAISLPHLWIYGATYPQSLAFLFLIIYLINRKNIYLFFTCGLLATFVHREGWMLFGLVLLAEVLEYLVLFSYRKWFKGKPFVLKWQQKGTYFASAVYVLPVQQINSFGETILFLLLQSSFLLWFYARKALTKPFWLTLLIVPLLVLRYDPRIISVTQLALIFIVTPELIKSKHKKTTILFFLIQLCFFLLEFGLGTIKILQK